ncbi:MAG: hypothetical protein JRF71_15125 [Deltaproteobacteria bacterium]|nr:hypothetical protein [Deltaproteobacteria bacterium]
MMSYDIPTKRDVEKVMDRIDRLEDLIKRSEVTASDVVLNTVGKFKKGVGFAEIQARTGFEEKKVRNIIFRLDKLGKIKRKSRGTYIIA